VFHPTQSTTHEERSLLTGDLQFKDRNGFMLTDKRNGDYSQFPENVTSDET